MSGQSPWQNPDASWREIYNAANDAIFIHDAETGAILDVNRKSSEVFGYSVEEFIKLSVGDFSSGEAGFTQDVAIERIRAAIEEGEHLFEWHCRKKSGELFWVEVNLKTATILDRDILLALVRDITSRKASEEAIKRSEEECRNLVESARDAIFTISNDGQLITLNQAFEKITGWSREAWIGRPFIEILHPEDQKAAIGLVTDLSAGSLPPISELRILCESGDYVIGEFASAPRLVDGIPAGILGIARDISYRKNLEDQLRQAQKLESIGTLAGGVAHDFNNMLNIVLAHTQLITRSDYDPMQLRDSIEAITKAGERGARIVQQLLTFARQTESVFEPIGINGIVEEIRSIITSTFPKTIDVNTSLADELPLFHGDMTQIHQVLLNLSVNARDAMPNGGEVSISTGVDDRKWVRKRHPEADQDRYLFIDIRDTGIGMDAETRLRIFEPFFTTKGTDQGTGLGLAVVYGIIQDHKGYLSVRSEHGVGTAFRIYLPALDQNAEEITPAARSEDVPSTIGEETILIVEDEDAIRDLLEDILRKNGYSVLTAVDGNEAVALFTEQNDSIDLVLSDVGLPGMSGDEVFHAIRKIEPDMKVILASGYLDADLHSALIRDGIADIIQKPYQFNDLLQRVRQSLDRDTI